MSAYRREQRTEDAIGSAEEAALVRPGGRARKSKRSKPASETTPAGAYSVEFTAAAEILREYDPVQFNSLRRLLKDKQVRLGEFDRLIDQRRRERVERSKRNRAVNAARIFTARITTEIRRDDGVHATREFEIQARLGGRTLWLVVAAAQFAWLKWVTEQLGARAVIAAGTGIKDQVREAIQLLSATQMVERTVHTHTGWRKLDRRWAYLHGGGALGATGAVTGVETSLPAALAPFILPAPPTAAELRRAIRASLAVPELAPDRVTIPTLGAVWRSILGGADFSVFVHGATGRFKTALASLLQQHFGVDFAANRLPGSC